MTSPQHVDHLRKRLREHRRQKGLSFELLAARIAEVATDHRISTGTVRHFILGNTEPHEMTVYAIEAYLKSVEGK